MNPEQRLVLVGEGSAIPRSASLALVRTAAEALLPDFDSSKLEMMYDLAVKMIGREPRGHSEAMAALLRASAYLRVAAVLGDDGWMKKRSPFALNGKGETARIIEAESVALRHARDLVTTTIELTEPLLGEPEGL